MRYAVRFPNGQWAVWIASGPDVGMFFGASIERFKVGEKYAGRECMGSVHSDAESLAQEVARDRRGKVVRLLGREESKRKFAAEQMRGLADQWERHGRDYWHTARLRQQAHELWPCPKKAARGRAGKVGG